MKTAIFADSFNPITNAHIAFAKEELKRLKVNRIIFFIDDTPCDISRELRYRMILNAIHPYRHFGIADKVKNCDFTIRNNSLSEASASVRKGDFSILCYANKGFISQRGLYLKTQLQSLLKESRYRHSCAVASLSAEIAIKHALDGNKAYLIGLYHDMTKYMDDVQSRSIMLQNGYYEIAYSDKVWHGATAYYCLKHTYKLNDKKMLQAIRHHTLGDHKGPYSKIVFIADKIEPTRGYDSSKEIELACLNLNKAFEIVHQQMNVYLQKEKHL